MLAPFAPHLAEELWAVLGHEPSIHHAPYPNWEPIYLEQDTYLYPVQHNGKVRLQVELPAKGLPEDLVQLALAHPKVVEWLNGRIPTKTIAVPGRIINMVLPNQP
jgi:leucyl-tRNA synthetase